MENEIFLYGRTRTRDYYDMYIPKWLTPSDEAYKDYRKIISHIFKIRDSIPEKSSGILKKTSDSFYFYILDGFCILCRCCYIASEDEYGRAICSTEGYICPSNQMNSFWLMVPDMILNLINMKKTYYQLYMEGVNDSEKLPSMHMCENIVQTVDILSVNPVSEKAEELISHSGINVQIMGLIHSMCERVLPFNFVIGALDKKLYSYTSLYSVPEISMYFTFDEMTTVSELNTWKAEYKPFRLSYISENITRQTCKLYLSISRLESGKFHYAVAAGSEPDSDNVVEVRYVSYEGEFDRSVDISKINDMITAVKKYLISRGWTQPDSNRLTFTKQR